MIEFVLKILERSFEDVVRTIELPEYILVPLTLISFVLAVGTWIVVARYTGSLPNPKQAKAIRFYGWITGVVSIAFPIILVGADLITSPGHMMAHVLEVIGICALLSVLYSIPGLVVLALYSLYWKWQEYCVRDDWVLAFTFFAVQTPNFLIMMLWVTLVIRNMLNHMLGLAPEVFETWLLPIKLLPVTLSVGVLLGLAAFRVARPRPKS